MAGVNIYDSHTTCSRLYHLEICKVRITKKARHLLIGPRYAAVLQIVVESNGVIASNVLVGRRFFSVLSHSVLMIKYLWEMLNYSVSSTNVLKRTTPRTSLALTNLE